MKKTILHLGRPLFICLLSGSLLMACNNGDSEKKEDTPKDEITAAEAGISGTKSDTTVNGTASFTKDSATGKVKLELELSVPMLANRSVAVHLHEHGDCGNSGNDSHGHWNPTHKQHGKWGTGEFHSGDIGNVSLDSAGKGMVSLDTDLWTLGGDSTTNILDRAVIVHSGVDDYTSQPAGNAGSRIGCGVIRKK